MLRKPNCLLASVALSIPIFAGAQAPRHQAYHWKSVQIVGGGFVDGVIFHPSAPGVRYARTDMGGAYRWDDGAHQWQPILDWVPYKDLNLMGVESIEVDQFQVRVVARTLPGKQFEVGRALRVLITRTLRAEGIILQAEISTGEPTGTA